MHAKTEHTVFSSSLLLDLKLVPLASFSSKRRIICVLLYSCNMRMRVYAQHIRSQQVSVVMHIIVWHDQRVAKLLKVTELIVSGTDWIDRIQDWLNWSNPGLSLTDFHYFPFSSLLRHAERSIGDILFPSPPWAQFQAPAPRRGALTFELYQCITNFVAFTSNKSRWKQTVKKVTHSVIVVIVYQPGSLDSTSAQKTGALWFVPEFITTN